MLTRRSSALVAIRKTLPALPGWTAALLLAAACGGDSPPADEPDDGVSPFCRANPTHPMCRTGEGEGEGEPVEGEGEPGEGEGEGEGEPGEGEGEAGAVCRTEPMLRESFLRAAAGETVFRNVTLVARHDAESGCLGTLEIRASAGGCLLTVLWPGGAPPEAGQSYGARDVQVAYEAGEGCVGGTAEGVSWFGGDLLAVEVSRWDAPRTLATGARSCAPDLDIEVALTGALAAADGGTLEIAESKLSAAGDALSDGIALPHECADDVCGRDDDCGDGRWCDAAGAPAVCLQGCRIGDAAGCLQGEFCTDDHQCDAGCDADDDCGGGETCDVAVHRCVGQACDDDGDCGQRRPYPESRYCNRAARPARCERGCRDAADCAPGQPCLPESRVCGCRGDGDCDGGELCEAGACVAACQDHAACGDGRFCDAGHCVVGCRSDELEPNNGAGNCRALPAAGGAWDLAMCGADNDTDWFCVDLGVGDSVVATATYAAGGVDLDMDLQNAAGARTVQQRGGAGRVSLQHGPVAQGRAGQYRLGVVPRDFADVDYHLDVAIQRGGACLPDVLEGGGNGSRDDATAMDDGGRFDDLTICDGGEDWYALHLRAGDGLSVTLDFDGADGWLLVEIYHPNPAFQQPVAESVNDRGDDRAAALLQGDDVITQGDYLVRVWSPDELRPIRYAMEARVLLGQIECLPDAHEAGAGNNERARAAALQAGLRRDLSLCSGDADWYSIVVPAGDVLNVRTERVADGRDFDHHLELFDGAGQSLDFSAQAGPRNSARADGTGAPVFINVRHPPGRQGEEIAYSLTLAIVDRPDDCDADDAFEPNDTRQTAASVGALLTSPDAQGRPVVNRLPGLVSCPDNADWYALDLTAWTLDDLTITARFDTDISDIDIELQDARGRNPCARDADCVGESITDDETISTGPQPPGVYYLSVAGLDAQPNDYDLEITVTPYVCDDDPMSGNQSRDDAFGVDLVGGAAGRWERDDLTICKNDSDWFAVDVAQADDLRVFIHFFHIQGDDLTLKVYDPAGAWIQNIVGGSVQGLSRNNDECVLVPGAAAGTYLVEVLGTGRESGYDIQIDAGDGLPACQE